MKKSFLFLIDINCFKKFFSLKFISNKTIDQILNGYIRLHPKNTDIYHNILEFIDSGTDDEKEYQKIFESLETTNKDEVRLFILMISKISENHFRFPYFFKKIESLILHFESQIKIFFNENEIYNIFKNSPRILLFLI